MGATSEKFAVVQHSGYAYGGQVEFQRGLEERRAATQAEQDTVVRAGGVLFDTRKEADEFCEYAMWPDEDGGLIPHARGTFADVELDGLRIYRPATEVTLRPSGG